jgi:hypothetical protein
MVSTVLCVVRQDRYCSQTLSEQTMARNDVIDVIAIDTLALRRCDFVKIDVQVSAA